MSSVDVFVPCYNYARYLRECVASVLSQSGPSVRVLIIDDASTDNTADVAAELAQCSPRVTVIRHTTNRGHIATYNEGIEWASAEYLLLLSADDYLLPDCLKRAVRLMNEHPEVSLVFGPAINLHSSGYLHVRPTFGRDRILSGRQFIKLSGASSIVTTSSAVVRTSVQKQIGGYYADLPHAGDMEMWLRFAAHGAVGYIAEPQSVYRIHQRNMSHSYYDGFLPALRQQELALGRFFSKYSCAIADGTMLYRRAKRLLAYSAIAKASNPLAEGRQDVSRDLTDFAQTIFPGVVRSWPWWKFTLKVKLGQRLYKLYRTLRYKHATHC